jgi:hypothetical protein
VQQETRSILEQELTDRITQDLYAQIKQDVTQKLTLQLKNQIEEEMEDKYKNMRPMDTIDSRNTQESTMDQDNLEKMKLL